MNRLFAIFAKNRALKEIQLKNNKKVYFASDFHLGAISHQESLIREKIICNWLDEIKKDAQTVFLLGDLFDYWFEHKRVAPKGFVRFLGKLAELSDTGIEIIIYTGNHDMWMRDYFEKEFGAEVYRNPESYLIGNKTFFIGHGDGLGPGDYFYKFLKIFFENRLARFLFRKLIHPDLNLWLGSTWANYSWKKNRKTESYNKAINAEKEILFQYCKEIEKNQHHDYYVFGHRHLSLSVPFGNNSQYINTGEWITLNSYAVFDGKDVFLSQFAKA